MRWDHADGHSLTGGLSCSGFHARKQAQNAARTRLSAQERLAARLGSMLSDSPSLQRSVLSPLPCPSSPNGHVSLL
jgi:hypothetical protein